MVRIIAHRGLNHVAPENTLAAFRAAARAGVTWLETDVDILGDGTPVILHDSTLDRTTNKHGSMYDLSSADLPSVDAGSWFSPDFAGEPLPTLEEFIRFVNDEHMNVNLEIKPNEQGKEQSLRLVDAVLDQLEHLDRGRAIIISSFNPLLLADIHRRAPHLPLGWLTAGSAMIPAWKSMLELMGATYLHPETTWVTPSRVELLHQAGFGVNTWTQNSRVHANEMTNWGVDGIITDVADSFL
ncbi:MAG: glycerophosphodiester phosphodiesterase family protein [Actinomycetaceae bacterium]|nr:glycerophosphodiester phosphodiesterase family protein [Actinomycetaceae bacterium]MDY6082353.1 glycerophosphodiester phosphodiesterase family protein [Actinomycetaceae bacterium]